MFDFVNKHKRILQLFLGLIALTFATWGIESYTRFRGARDELATVNGLSITQRDFESEFRQQQVGGAVMPPLVGLVGDHLGMRAAMMVPAACFAYVFGLAMLGRAKFER